MRWPLLVTIVGGAVLAIYAVVEYGPTDARNSIPIDGRAYHVTYGETLGVRVGDSWAVADATIRRFPHMQSATWETGDLERDGGSGLRSASGPVLTGDARASYDDRSWRKGTVTLRVHDGRVAEIVYSYFGPFYVDF